MKPLMLKTSTHLYHPDTWLEIEHIDDIKPLVAQNPGIKTFTHDTIQVMRYLINSPDVFTTAADLEARGLIFDLNGFLLSRPLHKFFNIGERVHAPTLITHGPGQLVTKLDGSMIAAFLLNGTLVFHTKGGVSKQAKRALECASTNVKKLAIAAIQKGYTPIFEWTAPENRVVIAYETNQLRLIALRHTKTGVYNDALMLEMAAHYNVGTPHVLYTITNEEDLTAALGELAVMDGIEGAVYTGPDGLRAKAKTTSYLLIHKTVSQLFYERHALRAVLEEIDDDILPLLRDDQRALWMVYATSIRDRLLAIAQEAETIAQTLTSDGKELAQAVNAYPEFLRPLIFSSKRGKDPVSVLTSMILKQMGSDTRVQQAKDTYTLPSWSPPPGLFLKD